MTLVKPSARRQTRPVALSGDVLSNSEHLTFAGYDRLERARIEGLTSARFSRGTVIHRSGVH
jgi:hypothetical protein